MPAPSSATPPDVASLHVSEIDNDAALRLIATVCSGYEACGDDDDVRTTIVRAGETTPSVRLLHDEAWSSRNVLGVERLDPTLSPELGCALVAAYCWREQLTGSEVPYLFDISSGRAFRLFPPDIATHAVMVPRANELRDAVARRTGRTTRVTLSPLRSVGETERYTLLVTLAESASDELREHARLAVTEVADHNPDFERVVIEAIDVAFEPPR